MFRNATRPVGTASVSVRVAADGTLSRTDGSALGAVGFTGGVASAQILAPSGIDPQETRDLPVAAYSATGQVLAIPYGAIRFEIVQGTDHLRLNADGSFTGLSEGAASVVARVDAVRTAPVLVRVNGPSIAVGSIDIYPYRLVAAPSQNRVFVVRQQTGYTTNLVSIDTMTGAIDTSRFILNASNLALSEDESTLFVVEGSYGIVRSYGLLPGGSDGGSFFDGSAYNLAVQPGNHSTFAVSTGTGASPALSGIAIIDPEGARPLATGPNGGVDFAWTSPKRIVSSVANGLRGIAVDARGAKVEQSVEVPGAEPRNLVYADGRIYAHSGGVFDAGSLATLGAFPRRAPSDPLHVTFAGPVVDVAKNRAYFVEVADDQTRLHVYRLDTFAEVADRALTGVEPKSSALALGSEPSLVRWGSKGLAFRVYDKIHTIDDVSGI